MDIGIVLSYLNKEYGCNIKSEYYNRIQVWEDWWRGFHKPFHQFREVSASGVRHRELYSLKMAKKVCEDWASILLNEKTAIVADDKASDLFLQGKEGEGGVLNDNDFWSNGNALIEQAFYSGTGSIIVKVKNGAADKGGKLGGSARIALEYLPAQSVIPLTVSNGKITEVAFASEVMQRGEHQIYLEVHTLEKGEYVIKNAFFRERNGYAVETDMPEGIAPEVRTGSGIPWFAIITPNIVNNIKNNNGLGISVYANALDNLQGVDLAYNNFNRDFKLGGKKVFYSQELLITDEDGNRLTPDDVAQQLFYQVGGEGLIGDGNDKVTEFNPSLRVQENVDGIQAQLDYLSFKCGLGTKHYQFNAGSVVTATQYMGDKQELIQNASKHYIVVKRTLQDLMKAILYVGKEVLGAAVDPETPIKISFDDSYIIDKESERLRDQQEIRDGIMQKWEYRVKWYGEDEATAKAMISDEKIGYGDE